MYPLYRTPTLYLVRHGETDLNDTNCFRSWTNPPLNENGLRSAEEVANYFSYEMLGKVACSDLQRTITTANHVLPFSTTHQYLDINPNVRPWGLGNLGGQPKNAKNLAKLEYYVSNPDVVPDGDDAESLNQFRARWHAFLSAEIANAVPGCPTVIVCSTSNVTATIQMEQRIELDDIVTPGGVIALYCSDQGIELEVKLGQVHGEISPEAS